MSTQTTSPSVGRIARWTAGGVEYEADPRQAERLVSDLALDDAKSVGTPGVKHVFEMTSRDKPLAVEKHTAFRAIAARGNYLGPDRPEMQYAAKEICRWMAAPSRVRSTSFEMATKLLGQSPAACDGVPLAVF